VPIGGFIIDRLCRRTIVLATDAGRALLLFALAAALHRPPPTLVLALLLAAYGALTALFRQRSPPTSHRSSSSIGWPPPTRCTTSPCKPAWWPARLGWSPQRPIRQAKERDQAAVQRWVDEDWPRIKANARRRRACLVFLDESGVSLLPNVRRTWAPRGRPPLLRHDFNWKRASMAAALCYGIGGGGATVAFQVQAGSYDTASLIGVLKQLRLPWRAEGHAGVGRTGRPP